MNPREKEALEYYALGAICLDQVLEELHQTELTEAQSEYVSNYIARYEEWCEQQHNK